MDLNPSAEWFLEVHGTKTGPYTVEHIHALLTEGQISPLLRVTSDRLSGEWITVQEMLQAYSSSKISGEFQPPPRPDDIEKALGSSSAERQSEDATLGLFDALQAAREKKHQSVLSQQRVSSNVEMGWAGGSRSSRSVPPQLWLILSLFMVLSAAVWGLMKIASKSFPQGGAGVASSSPVKDVSPASGAASQSASSAPAAVANPAPVSRPVPVRPAPTRAANPPNFSAYAPPPKPQIDESREREAREREREREEAERARNENDQKITDDSGMTPLKEAIGTDGQDSGHQNVNPGDNLPQNDEGGGGAILSQ
jgi:hypothetical protein